MIDNRMFNALCWVGAIVLIIFLAFVVWGNDKGSPTEVGLLQGTSASTPLDCSPSK